MLSNSELSQTEPAEQAAFRSPVPTQIVSNGEFNPLPQTAQQRRFEERVKEFADAIARKLALERRQFLRTGCGMAAAFLAMNDVFGRLFVIDRAEAAEPAAAAERTNSLAGQFIFDDQVHFVRDDYQGERILRLAKYASEHWNPDMLKDAGLTLARYKFDNFVKEIFLDSDTKIGLLSGAPFDDPALWFLTNDQIVARTGSEHSLGRRCVTSSCAILFKRYRHNELRELGHANIRVRVTAWRRHMLKTPLDDLFGIEVPIILARISHAHVGDRAWLERMGLRLDNLVEAGERRTACQVNFYSRGRKTPCACRVLWSRAWGPY
jgi:hypothetical protein